MPIGASAPSLPGAPTQALLGPWHQQAGGVWVVDTQYEIDRLFERLMTEGEVFGWDTETVGVNPKKESAARGVGQIVCWSAAFFDETLGKHPLTGYPLARRVFVKNWGEAIERRWLYKFQPWFDSEKYLKVGANVFSFDRHVLWNHGIDLKGIVFDNVRASRLNDPSSWSHSLKDQGLALGYEIREYGELFKRPALLKSGKEGSKMVLVPLTEVVKDPEWLAQLIDYASLDAKMSLEAWPPMADKLRERKWVGEKTMLDFYNEKLNPYMYVLTGMERNGWELDTQYCFEQAKIAEYDAGQLERKLVQWVGARINFGSPVQLAHFLYGKDKRQVVKANPNQIQGRGFAIPPVSRPRKIKPGQVPSPPTDEIALSYLSTHVRSQRDREGIKTLLEWRTVTKTQQYLTKLPTFLDTRGQNRVHCQVSPDAETGRLTAKNPPLQQIPKPGKDPVADRYCVREAFTCPPGWGLICADYSQLEMRILAHFLKVLFNDTKLADDLESGDLHAAAALRTFGREEVELPEDAGLEIDIVHKWEELDPFVSEATTWTHEMDKMVLDTPLKAVKKFFPQLRDKGKILNFSLNYGKTAFGLGNDFRDDNDDPIGEDAAQEILDKYFRAYPAIAAYKKWSINYARKRGYARTLLGRYRPLIHIWQEVNRIRAHAERQAQNTPIQGSAMDVAMSAQLKVNTHDVPLLRDYNYYDDELARMDVQHIMQVHDELVFRCPWSHIEEASARVKVLMENPMDKALSVPIPVEVGYGTSWYEAH